MNSEPSNLEEIPVQFELGQRITTKRGYEGTYITRLMEKPVAIVILDGCTYSDSHWYDEIPLADITAKTSFVFSPMKSAHTYCPQCGLVYNTAIAHTCPNGGYPLFPLTPPKPCYPNYPVYC